MKKYRFFYTFLKLVSFIHVAVNSAWKNRSHFEQSFHNYATVKG